MRTLNPAIRAGLVAAALVVALPFARAQNSTQDEIAALRAQIDRLDLQLRRLERKDELQDEGGRVTVNDRGLTIASVDAANSVRLRGLVQLDSRSFFNDSATVNDTFVLRRARIITEGQFAKNYSFQVVSDFGGSAPAIVDANLGIAVTPRLQLKFGRLKSPVGLELLQSDSWTFFNERSIVTNLVPNRDLGVQASGDVLDNRLNYMVGIFGGVPDAGSTSNTDFDSEKTFVGRLYATPFRNVTGSFAQGLSFGVSGSVGREKTASGRTAGYRTDAQQTFFSYAAATVADGRNWRVSPQFEFRKGPIGVLGEYVVSAVNVRPSATGAKTELQNKAWQLAAGYVLTGENSAYGGVVPAKNFDVGAGTWGAFEIAARFATLNVDDNAFPTFASAATSADTANSFGLGLSWYLSKSTRATFDYYHTDFDFAPGATPATTTVIGNGESALITRVQLTF